MTLTPGFRKVLARSGASVLSASPAVAAAYERDFEKNMSSFAEFARANGGAAFLLQLGFEHETDEPASRLAASISRFREQAPGTRVIVLCNCLGEVAALDALGLETRFIHQNCFLDERRYRPMGGTERRYDAAYIARVTPFKRHSLIPDALSPRLLLVGTKDHYGDPVYKAQIRERFPDAGWVSEFRGVDVSVLLAKAKCGLALSAAEGACFASAEYLLCGLPVVDTPALGGRAALYPEEYVREVEAAPEAVGEGIAYWCAHRPDPRKIRAAWLAKAEQHRDAYRELMRELTGRIPGRPPHKLGVRTPHCGALWSLAVQAYLAARSITA